MTRLILDSGDPEEYKITAKIAYDNNQELWGGTTNPSLIAKKLAMKGKKLTKEEAFELQKDIVLQILDFVPGAVSVEVYADSNTTAEEMISQGEKIASWHERVVIKLPTTIEGFKARTVLRKQSITTNNTLVFSQPQIVAICIHENLVQKTYDVKGQWPSFISPFIGRLDDIGEDGLSLVKNGLELKKQLQSNLWMLAASIRNIHHLSESITLGSELVTAPLKVYEEWFLRKNTGEHQTGLKISKLWNIPDEVRNIDSLASFMQALETDILNISHPLTDKGLERFANDWNALISDKRNNSNYH
jgi:transaldolase